MCRQTIAGSETKDELGHLDWIASLLAPVGLQRVDHSAHGRFIIREQIRGVFIRASAPVRPHSTGFERTHPDAKGSQFLSEGLGKSPNSPFGGMVRRIAGPCQAAA